MDALLKKLQHRPGTPITVVDAPDDLASTIDTIDATGPVCVMTSWAAGYLSPRGRGALADVLDEVGTRREVLWLSLEAPGVVDLFDQPVHHGHFDIVPSVVGVVRFRKGKRDACALACVHPHGKSLEWT